MSGIPSERLDTLLACSCIWSARLTFNYWRKGGYSIGSEDYRWEVLRTKIRPSLFFLFNVTFISLAQNLLLVAITFPTYVLLLASRLLKPEMTTSDIIFSRAMAGVVLVEFFADQQQWRFQGAKKQYQNTAKVPPKFAREDLDRGFIVSGLWSLSRHPNFAAEMAFWISLYQWSCFATDTFYNWAGVGALGYVILFQASTWFTELISAGKYPEYKEYQQRVGKFLPKLW
jgi:steroid 5-alpha reductase family enzyme